MTERSPAVPPAPATRRDDVVDVIHGVEVPDPFRWLEDGGDPTVKAWTSAQNERTRAVLDALDGRDELHGRLSDLLRVDMVSAPQVAGDRLFTIERGGDRDQAVLTVRSATAPTGAGSDATGGVLLVDPQELLDEETAALDWYRPSPDGGLVAFGCSTGGDERSVLRVIDVATGKLLPDEIPNTRAASVAWLPDATAFAYTRYPDPESAGEEDRNYWRTVWWHQLGDHVGHDEQVFAELPEKTAWPDVDLSKDGRWLLIHVGVGWERVDVHVVDRTTGERTTAIEGADVTSRFEVVDGALLGVTTLDASRGRIVRAPLDDPRPENWETVIAESEAVLEGFVVTRDSLLVTSTRTAVAYLDRYDRDGGGRTSIELPELGSLAGLDGSDEREEAWFAFTSFTRPPQLFRWTPDGVEARSPAPSALDPDRFTVEQVRYPSADGTMVSMFLVRAAGAVPDPSTATILTGYGGFAVTLAPAYSAAAVAHCEAGGLYAQANLRGGLEEGEDWHRAGQRANKLRVFEDFEAAAEWLVARGHTSVPKLAIRGGSNGGLLVGACLTRRPDLFRAVQCAVPLLDMIRFPRFLIAKLWTSEYGDPDVAEEFAWLWEYSPYHRVVDGTCYPSVLFTTGEQDSRVDPNHARKMAARLQEATGCGDDHPILIRLESMAGHGQGKPAGRQADELTDVLSFLRWQLGG
jgi:prolyl oligopeptidase